MFFFSFQVLSFYAILQFKNHFHRRRTISHNFSYVQKMIETLLPPNRISLHAWIIRKYSRDFRNFTIKLTSHHLIVFFWRVAPIFFRSPFLFCCGLIDLFFFSNIIWIFIEWKFYFSLLFSPEYQDFVFKYFSHET